MLSWRWLPLVFVVAFPALAARPVQIAGGNNHSCAIFEDGSLQCWGTNNAGQLGLADVTVRLVPTRVPLAPGEQAIQVDAGGDHTCALFKGGYVKCWGNNNAGQLGLEVALASIGGGFNQAVDRLPPIKLGTGAKAIKIALGISHSCALLEGGAIKCWGGNTSGALGLGDVVVHGNTANSMGDGLAAVNLGTGVKAVDVEAGAAHTCAILDDGKVKCWGNAIAIGSGAAVNLGTSPLQMGDKLLPLNLGSTAHAIALAAGTSHTCALLETGDVRCWGQNRFGVLGMGRATEDTLGDAPNEMGDKLPETILGSLRAESLGCGTFQCCALLENAAVRCWGLNTLGQLGLGDQVNRGISVDQMGEALSFVDLGRLAEVTRLEVGKNHSCVALGNGDLKCWGANQGGQLGTGNTTSLGTLPTQMGDALPALVFRAANSRRLYAK